MFFSLVGPGYSYFRKTSFIQMKQIVVSIRNDKIMHIESHISTILF